jgi:hypothetical protein
MLASTIRMHNHLLRGLALGNACGLLLQLSDAPIHHLSSRAKKVDAFLTGRCPDAVVDFCSPVFFLYW